MDFQDNQTEQPSDQDETQQHDLLKGSHPTVVSTVPADEPQTVQPEKTGEEAAVDMLLGLEEIEEEEEEEEKRRKLLFLLFFLVGIFCCVGGLFANYLVKPKPLPELLPEQFNVDYRPHYLFSIYGLDTPMGVTVSPDGQYIYGTESGGERLIKVFNRDGEMLFSFAPPRTEMLERSPVYLATDSTGRVFVVDRIQHAVFAYDANGNYLDSLIDYELALSEYVYQHTGQSPVSLEYAFDIFDEQVFVQNSGVEQTLPIPDILPRWSPLGIRIDGDGRVLITDVNTHVFWDFQLPADDRLLTEWHNANLMPQSYGSSGSGKGQLLYPNTTVVDSQGRLYVSDSNNYRVDVWDADGRYVMNFGGGTGEGAISLPRGAFIDHLDRLYIADAVGQNITVYDVSGPEPVFLFTFGDFGSGDGLFSYPNDIYVDDDGRLYIVDRENHRIQVWSY